jgi:hypothetical protein
MEVAVTTRAIRHCLTLAIVASIAISSVTVAGADSAGTRTTLTVTKLISTPDGRGPLSRQHLNVVTVHPNIAFKVTIRNEAAQRLLRVTLSITRAPTTLGSIVKSKTVVFASNQTQSVRFGKLGQVAFAVRETLKVSVADPQTHELWVARYPVIFALG